MRWVLALALQIGVRPEPALTLVHPENAWALCIAGVSDVDGDGSRDVAVGYGDRALVFSGRDGRPVRMLAGRTEWVAGLGDLDGDLCGDLLVSASVPLAGDERQVFATEERRLAAVSGATGRTLYELCVPWPHQSARWIGAADVDLDGFADFVLPRYVHEDKVERAGAEIRSGTDGRVLSELALPGGPLVVGPDLDGDGMCDVLTLLERALVCVSARTGETILRLEVKATYNAGWTSDMDGDGLADVFTFPEWQEGWKPDLAIFSSTTGLQLASLRSREPFDEFGYYTAELDLDHDGQRELLVGAYGHDVAGDGADYGEITFYSYETRDVLTRLTGWEVRMGLGCSMANVGDLDGDGDEELAVQEHLGPLGSGRNAVVILSPEDIPIR